MNFPFTKKRNRETRKEYPSSFRRPIPKIAMNAGFSPRGESFPQRKAKKGCKKRASDVAGRQHFFGKTEKDLGGIYPGKGKGTHFPFRELSVFRKRNPSASHTRQSEGDFRILRTAYVRGKGSIQFRASIRIRNENVPRGTAGWHCYRAGRHPCSTWNAGMRSGSRAGILCDSDIETEGTSRTEETETVRRRREFLLRFPGGLPYLRHIV